MTCTHPHGDFVAGTWLCGRCYAKLDSRPARYSMEAAPDSGTRTEDVVPVLRQAKTEAPIRVAATGLTLSQFIEVGARRVVVHCAGTMALADAIDYIIDLLRVEGAEFGSPDFDWSEAGAWELVTEDMAHWDRGRPGANT